MSDVEVFDTVVIELQKNGTSKGSVSISSKDLESLKQKHNVEFEDIIFDMYSTILEEARKRSGEIDEE